MPYKKFFPFEEVRFEQDKLIDAIARTLNNKSSLIVHAPTGLGKTAAAITPSLREVIDKKKTLFFLTNRLTQHKLALDTIRLIAKKHNLRISFVDLIGKKGLCLREDTFNLKSSSFYNYCKLLREEKQCIYYNNIKEKNFLSKATNTVINRLKDDFSINKLKDYSKEFNLCPYEIALLLAKEASIIIADYQYLFNPGIRNNFLQKINKELKDIILIVDEAHNLLYRAKESVSIKISSITLKRAFSEAEKHNIDTFRIKSLIDIFYNLSLTIDENAEERFLRKEDLLFQIKKIEPEEEFINWFKKMSESVLESQSFSYLESIYSFLKRWIEGEDEGFARIINLTKNNKGEEIITIHYKCLDPSVVTKPVFEETYANIVMSGTLLPTYMYRDLYGLFGAEELVLESPFPKKNRLGIIIPKTSTKFTSRSEIMYSEIAKHISRIINLVPGNSAIFFPSYQLLKEIIKKVNTEKKLFIEEQDIKDKDSFIREFKNYHKENNKGAVLAGVIGGSFSEGIDFPGNELLSVIIVGLPLQKPDLETKALINYFDKKFGKGWDYGYIFPAINKALQSAGRCIRNENDKGVIIFLDERYSQENYFRLLPKDWDMKITLLYEKYIKEFFDIKDLKDYF